MQAKLLDVLGLWAINALLKKQTKGLRLVTWLV